MIAASVIVNNIWLPFVVVVCYISIIHSIVKKSRVKTANHRKLSKKGGIFLFVLFCSPLLTKDWGGSNKIDQTQNIMSYPMFLDWPYLVSVFFKYTNYWVFLELLTIPYFSISSWLTFPLAFLKSSCVFLPFCIVFISSFAFNHSSLQHLSVK